MDSQKLIDILENAGLEVRPNYSGRGMYGEQCVGFVVEESQLLRTVAELVFFADDDREQVAKLFRRARTDSMGRDSIIVYFPSVQSK